MSEQSPEQEVGSALKRWFRKRWIELGLSVVILGSAIAASHDSRWWALGLAGGLGLIWREAGLFGRGVPAGRLAIASAACIPLWMLMNTGSSALESNGYSSTASMIRPLGLVVFAAGLVLGVIAWVRIRRGLDPDGGRNYAVAGVVIPLALVGLSLLGWTVGEFSKRVAEDLARKAETK
jgi:hypothetical protein